MNSAFLLENRAIYGCLASQHGLGPTGFARLLRHGGTPENVYAASPDAWRTVHPALSEAMAESLSAGPNLPAWEALVGTCMAQGITVTAPGWPGYPQPLLDLEAPPPLLYVRGSWLPEDARAVALVGTRNPTAYGREAAFVLARDLAAAGFTVVSGLALGVDAAAHAGALAAPARAGAPARIPRGRTLAVVGCGVDIAYPLENLDVRARIEESGAVLSEFPPGTPPRPAHFPRRNKWISALARATVVVEAGAKSGALLTAAHARNQGKPLFAVPGPIFSNVSSGTHALLRKGALLAASAEDVIAVLEGRPPRRNAAPQVPPELPRRDPASGRARTRKARDARSTRPTLALESPEAAVETFSDPVLALWGGDAVCALDALAARAVDRGVWPPARAAAALLESLLQLELRGLVQRLPGAAYRRVSR